MVHLHLHTEYSLLDSIIKIPELVKELKFRGSKACAITDHGTLGGWVEFYKECKKADIKPILGVEFYHSLTRDSKENYHITLLARTEEGYRNLIKLNNLSNGNFYKKPRVTTEMLMEHGKGIIGLSGCLQGYLAQSVLHEEFDFSFYMKMQKAFDGFYLEIQDSGLKEQRIIKNAFEKTNLPMVPTVDSHYLRKDDAFAHEVSLGIMTNKKISDPKAMKFNSSEYYVKDDLEMECSFDKSLIKVTDEIANLIEEYDIMNSEWILPDENVNVDMEYQNLVLKLYDYCMVDFALNQEMYDQYKERLSYEFSVICDNGFLSYFKMVADLCDHFDSNNMFRGWGRGSASGSLVSFLYGITKIDPIKWDLYFERFLNPDRISPPDIDLDFMPEHKSVAIDFFKQKYGDVFQIGNYGTLATKEAIKSVSRIMEYNTDLHEYVPNQAPVPMVCELIENNKVFSKEAKKEDKVFIDVVLKLEGLKRNFSTHASGVVISSDIPVRVSKSGVNKDLGVTVWDMYSLEDLKYTKFDILGVNALSIIDRVCKSINIKVDDINLDDEVTFDLIRAGKTIGVFQWESEGFRKLIDDLHPDTFDELLDLNTLYRPGCLESGLTQQYIDRKFGREKVEQLHPKLSMKTQGLPLYQEDIMKMAQVLAGFTLAEADILRKAIGKKIKKDFEKIQVMWIDGCCTTSGMTDEESLKIWDMIEKFARYTWNKSHSVAYTLISWWTAYLSAHYPAEFLCELLNGADSVDRRRILFSECRSRGIDVLHPDINLSGGNFTVKDGSILTGLSGIKFIGDKVLDSLLKYRENVGVIKDKEELTKNTIMNKRHIEYLEKSGAFGKIPTLEEEREVFGYNIGKRIIDTYWWSEYSNEIGEIIDIHTITTKKGDPMCFIKVEFKDIIDSIVVFPSFYQKYKDFIEKGFVGLFKKDSSSILQFMDEINVSKFNIEVVNGEEFLSFNPSLQGRANIFCEGISISSANITDEFLVFVDKEFGIRRLFL